MLKRNGKNGNGLATASRFTLNGEYDPFQGVVEETIGKQSQAACQKAVKEGNLENQATRLTKENERLCGENGRLTEELIELARKFDEVIANSDGLAERLQGQLEKNFDLVARNSELTSCNQLQAFSISQLNEENRQLTESWFRIIFERIITVFDEMRKRFGFADTAPTPPCA